MFHIQKCIQSAQTAYLCNIQTSETAGMSGLAAAFIACIATKTRTPDAAISIHLPPIR
jgi:hypothetical protein